MWPYFSNWPKGDQIRGSTLGLEWEGFCHNKSDNATVSVSVLLLQSCVTVWHHSNIIPEKETL